jgi:hypothetical protein
MKSKSRAMVAAAQAVEALIPARLPPEVRNKQENSLSEGIYRLHENSAQTAYQWAAASCFSEACDATSFDNMNGINEVDVANHITDDERTLRELKAMCEPGYAWGAKVVTL